MRPSPPAGRLTRSLRGLLLGRRPEACRAPRDSRAHLTPWVLACEGCQSLLWVLVPRPPTGSWSLLPRSLPLAPAPWAEDALPRSAGGPVAGNSVCRQETCAPVRALGTLGTWHCLSPDGDSGTPSFTFRRTAGLKSSMVRTTHLCHTQASEGVSPVQRAV